MKEPPPENRGKNSVSSPQQWPRPGDRIGGYMLEKELGRGGTSRVYLARYQGSQKVCALKVFSTAFSENPADDARFLERARSCTGFKHPNLISIWGAGKEDGHCYVVMEYVKGRSLNEILRENRLTTDEILAVISGTASALDALWKNRDFRHGDIKPDNIIVEKKSGRVCLTDMLLFSLSASSGEITGTPQYISPEQIRNGQADIRSDLYSLGVTFYQLIVRKLPFNGKTTLDILTQHLRARPETPRQADASIPPELEEIILKLMDKDPKKRYQTPEELLEAIRGYRREHSTGSSGGKAGIRDLFGDREKAARMIMKEESVQSRVVQSMQTRREMIFRLVFLGIFAGVAVIIGVIVVVMRWIIFLPSSGDAEYEKRIAELRHHAQARTAVAAEKKMPVPEISAYIQQASGILRFIEQHPTETSLILDRCDRFFRRFPEPVTERETRILNQLLSVFIPLDEVRCENARKHILPPGAGERDNSKGD